MMWCGVFGQINSTGTPVCIQEMYGPIASSQQAAGEKIFPFLPVAQQATVKAVRMQFFDLAKDSNTYYLQSSTIPFTTNLPGLMPGFQAAP